MKPATRKVLLGIMLLATAVTALWPLPDDDDAISPSTGRPASSKGNSNATAISRNADTGLPAVQPLNAAMPVPSMDSPNSSGEISVSNLFPSQTWTPPPPPQQETTPVAPPLPFTFGGRYVEAGQTIVFLVDGERIYSARVGDTVNGGYRLDAIEPATLRLTYLPLNIRQDLRMGPMTPQ